MMKIISRIIMDLILPFSMVLVEFNFSRCNPICL